MWRNFVPLGLLALPFATVYALLLCLLPDALSASADMGAAVSASGRGGIETLYMLNACLLGWAGVRLLERRVGMVGYAVLLFTIPCCAFAVVLGFGVAGLILGTMTELMMEAALASFVFSAGASVVRVVLDRFELL